MPIYDLDNILQTREAAKRLLARNVFFGAFFSERGEALSDEMDVCIYLATRFD